MSEFTLVTGDWLLRTLAVGAGVLLLGVLAVRLSRLPATRRRLAATTVRAALLVPLLGCLPGWVSIPVAGPGGPLPAERPAPDLRPQVEHPFEWPTELVAVDVPQATPVVSPDVIPQDAESNAVTFDWRFALLILHATISLAMLGQLIRGHCVLRRLWRASRPLPGRLAARFEKPRAEVRVSDRIASALCFGFRRPRVLLPLTFARTASARELRWVAAHEFDHARRGDYRTAYWVGLCRSLYFAVPWFWLLRRDLQLSQEYLADAAAARAEPAEYAAFLVDLSASGPSRPRMVPLVATGVGAVRSELYRRVTMLLTSRAASRWPSRLWTGLAATAVLTVAVLASAVRVTAAPADEPKPKAKAADPDKPQPKVLPADPVDPMEIRRKLMEQLRKGNPDPNELRQLIEEMNAQMAEQFRQRMGRGGFPFQGLPNGALNPFAPAEPVKPAIREQYEKQLRQFDDEIAKNADNADAQAALKKAREAYVEAMADELKKADGEARKNPLAVPNFPNVQVLPFAEFPAFPPMPNGRNPFAGRAGGVRPQPTAFGVQVEKPSPILVEQLDLPADVGAVVSAVVADSPADKAGLKKNDVLLKVAGKPVPSDPAEFADLLGKLKSSDKFDIELIRKGKKETVKGAELPQPKKPAPLVPGGRLEEDRFVPGGRLEEDRFVPGGRLEEDRMTFNQMQVQVINGDVSLRAMANGVTFAITGTAPNGKVLPSKIVIEDGEKKEYPSVEKVPEKHRAAVQQLLGQVQAFGGRR